jgi:glycine/D-amino acid oxidase-like deaminating enzyme/nitrite reductase/ring-hydroxylating ferredoxin subunit
MAAKRGFASLWAAGSEVAAHPRLQETLSADVLILGAGITGLTAALKLTAHDRKVIVLEAHRVGASSTGNSTGNLYAPVSDGLAQISHRWGERLMHQLVESRRQAVTFIEETVRQHNIACAFRRCPWVLYAPQASAEHEQTLQEEYQAALDAGLPAHRDPAPALPFAAGPALRIDGQAQFNPFHYAQGLARVLGERGVRIFEHTPAVEIDAQSGTVATPEGRVHAQSIIIATHTPKGLSLLHTELGPYREYAVALRLQGDEVPAGIFWQLGERRTLRTYQEGDRTYLVVVGEKHKTGQAADAPQRYARLERFAREHFAVGELTHRWSAQSYHAADRIPYIGPVSERQPLYVASGFSTDGLVYGTAAALVLGNRILGASDPLGEVYDPRRFPPLKAGATFVKENVNAAAHLVKGWVAGAELDSVAQIPAGEGRLVRHAGERLAVYRDSAGSLTALSPICPHMGCLVHWNAADTSWDCPCHGSRFGIDGSVLEGPALSPLSPRRLE